MKFLSKLRWLPWRKRHVTLLPVAVDQGSIDKDVPAPLEIAANYESCRQTPMAIPKEDDTLIGADALMTGSLKVGGRVILEGRVSGVIEQKESGANVFVDENAIFRGEITASNALVYGHIEGAITAARISIEKTANVTGVIEYQNIRIKGGLNGAVLNKNNDLRLLVEDKETLIAITN